MSASLLSGLEIGIAILDEAGTLALANRDFYDLTGYDMEKAPKLNLPDLWPDAQQVLSSVSEVHGEWRGEARMTRKDGTAVPLSLTVTSAVRAHGAPDGFVVKLRTLSRADKPGAGARGPAWLDQTTTDKPSAGGDDNTGKLEHHLRNLLTTISGNLELLDRSAQDCTMRRRVALMLAAAKSGLEALESIQRRSGE